MKRTSYFIIFTIAFVFLASNFATAEILVSQPQSVYNIADSLNLQVTIRPHSQTTDFFIVQLNCPNGHVDLYRNPLTIGASQSFNVTINTELSKAVVNDLEGTCYFSLNYAQDSVESQRFDLSRSLIIDLTRDSSSLNPGESTIIQGNVRKANGQVVTGFLDIFVGNNNISYNELITNGSFRRNVTLPLDIAAGQHIIRVHASEKDSNGDVTNEGEETQDLTVKSIVRNMEIVLSKTEVSPNSTISFSTKVTDQTGNLLNRDVSYVLYTPKGDSFFKGLGKTNTEQGIALNSQVAPGYWKLESKVDNSIVKKLVYVQELQAASFVIQNDTLLVTNEGNIVYKKVLDVSIGDHTELLEVDIPVSQSKKFKLSAPSSLYEVKISDGTSKLEASNVALTGKAIGIGEITISPLSKAAIGIFILIILCLMFVTNFYVKKKQASLGLIKNTSSNSGKLQSSSSSNSVTKRLPTINSLVEGNKAAASVIALKADALTSSSQEAINNAVAKARKAGAHVYEDNTNTLMVFSPSLTKKATGNEILAAQIAQEISSSIEEHNKKMKDKIDYGIGIGRGEVIIENKSGAKSVTSLGTLIPSTKRLASSSKGEILMTDEIYKSVMGSVKAEKSADGQSWKLKDIINREQHKGFINSFLNRQDKK